jgi:hypothetical protein
MAALGSNRWAFLKIISRKDAKTQKARPYRGRVSHEDTKMLRLAANKAGHLRAFVLTK